MTFGSVVRFLSFLFNMVVSGKKGDGGIYIWIYGRWGRGIGPDKTAVQATMAANQRDRRFLDPGGNIRKHRSSSFLEFAGLFYGLGRRGFNGSGGIPG